ncbi:ABC transporter ATP-binding protein [uncultured Ruminococcus sp.]|uniref:ABC transporter ATP-binding protein n=1 Tax=uncultured Ruminococcus sp. TaxID=165186 RepID=UPI00259A8968|nr:ABC transporter ATP-binding protein [uncultured Ruminococcus sp.]
MKFAFYNERKKICSSISDVLSGFKKPLLALSVFRFLCLILIMIPPILYGMIIDNLMFDQNFISLLKICSGYVVLFVLESILAVSEKSLQVKTYNRIKFEIKKRIWGKYLDAPMTFFEKHGAGKLKESMDKDVNAYETFISDQLITYGYHIVVSVILFLVLIIINWKLAAFSLLMVPVSFWMSKRMADGSGKAWQSYWSDFGKYVNWLYVSLSNWKEIKVLNIYDNQIDEFTGHWGKMKRDFFKGNVYFFINKTFGGFSNFFITKLNLYFIGGLLIYFGQLHIAMLFVFIKYYEIFFGSVVEISNLNVQLKECQPLVERANGILNTEFPPQGQEKTDYNSMIEFHNVSFSYDGSQKEIIHNASFNIKNKACTALAGKSGHGKTTLIKLLLGLYTDYSGSIIIGGKDIRALDRNDFYSHVSVVMQDSALFNVSVKENIRFANSEASDDDIYSVCKKANIHQDIMNMPQQYDTIIGEKGVMISGGQKQRLSIARALIRNPDILIFDEATSALDSESEALILQTIEEVRKNHTVIIIAHRMSSILISDEVVMIENGEIVSQGSYQELAENDSYFRSLFEGQYSIAEQFQ